MPFKYFDFADRVIHQVVVAEQLQGYELPIPSGTDLKAVVAVVVLLKGQLCFFCTLRIVLEFEQELMDGVARRYCVIVADAVDFC